MSKAKLSERNKAMKKFIGKQNKTKQKSFESTMIWEANKSAKERERKIRAERKSKAR